MILHHFHRQLSYPLNFCAIEKSLPDYSMQRKKNKEELVAISKLLYEMSSSAVNHLFYRMGIGKYILSF